MTPKCSIVGLGKLGCSMAAAIASRGIEVIGVDINQRTVELLNAGHAPVQETNLEKVIQENKLRLHATLSHEEAVHNSDISFVIVPTPSDERGAFSLQYAKWAFRKIGQALAEKGNYHLVVLTSTVLPGSTRYGLLPILEKESGKKCGPDFGVCYSPEFIALGSVIKDFLNPDFTLVGEFDERSGTVLEECYGQIMLNSPPCKRMSIENAELTKVALNTYVTTKITYANMLAELCERIPGGDVDIVTDAIGTDSRIGKEYLTGALGYGGPCFPRDNVALSFFANEVGTKAELAETTHSANQALVGKFMKRFLNVIDRSKTIAVLGMAYKPYSHVIEKSHSVFLARAMANAGFRVVVYDSLAGDMVRNELKDKVVVLNSLKDCLDQADIFLLTTTDPEFKALSGNNFKGRNVTVIDFWRIFDKKSNGFANINYIPVGRSINDSENESRLVQLWNNMS
jgi:UDPglucose 6-dehydrogenase